jgi:Putative binding domain, N-terminal/Viral BACON domain
VREPGFLLAPPVRKMRTLTTAVGVILMCGSWLACSSSTQNVTGPSTTRCPVTAVAEPARFGAGGGGGTLTVSTNRECSWNATSSDNWLQLGAGSSGQGNAKVAFSVTANADPSQRRGAIAISEQQVAISQDAAPCVFTVPPRDTVSPDGERRTLNVTANGSDCSWTARSETEWLAVVQGSQGNGSGQVVYEAPPTRGPTRSGELTIAGHRVTVTQGTGCSIGIAPTAQTVGADGGSGAISVTTDAGCPWSAQSETAWISITSATSGTGPATVAFRVGASDGPSRTGALRIGEQVFTVRQNSGCRFSINPESHSVASTGGSGTVAVTTVAGCEWTATSSASWVTIASGGGRNGNGTVQFAVAATTGPARSGTLTIAGRRFVVSQSSGCTFSINPTSQNLPYGGGSGSVAVSTSDGCSWTTASPLSWVRFTSGQNGTGPGPVTFTFDETPSSLPRSGTVSIAGQTFAITQDGAPCSYVLGPPSAAVGAGGGSGSFEVNTKEGCTWNATSNDAWLRVTAGASGTGDGTVSFSADANPGPARTGTIVAGGRTFTASQAGVGGIRP